MTTYILDVHVY